MYKRFLFILTSAFLSIFLIERASASRVKGEKRPFLEEEDKLSVQANRSSGQKKKKRRFMSAPELSVNTPPPTSMELSSAQELNTRNVQARPRRVYQPLPEDKMVDGFVLIDKPESQ